MNGGYYIPAHRSTGMLTNPAGHFLWLLSHAFSPSPSASFFLYPVTSLGNKKIKPSPKSVIGLYFASCVTWDITVIWKSELRTIIFLNVIKKHRCLPQLSSKSPKFAIRNLNFVELTSISLPARHLWLWWKKRKRTKGAGVMAVYATISVLGFIHVLYISLICFCFLCCCFFLTHCGFNDILRQSFTYFFHNCFADVFCFVLFCYILMKIKRKRGEGGLIVCTSSE